MKPPLTRPLMTPLTISPFVKASRGASRCVRAWLFAREPRSRPKPSSTASSADLDLLADLDVDYAVLIPELIRGYDGFGFQADADDDDIGIHVDDGAGQDLTWLELLIHARALFEKLLERFGHWVFRATGPIVVTFRTASRRSGS